MPNPCQLCPSPHATVHLTEFSPTDGRLELHVCRDCVARLGLALDHPPPLASLLVQAQALAQVGEDLESVVVPNAGEACPQCGLEFSAYVQSNLFGCGECYQAFAPQVAELVQRYHGAVRHVGRLPAGIAGVPEAAAVPAPATATPSPATIKRRKAATRATLTTALSEAIAREQFERAAALRDQLASLDAESGTI